MAVLGIDIGATTVKLGVVDARGRITVRGRLSTRAERGPEDLLDRIAAWAGRLPRRPHAAGAGFCGMVDAVRGTVMETTDTMPRWNGLALARELESRLGVPTRCDNDGNCAALGEATFGAGRGTGSMAMLTLGTGVGGGIVWNGAVVRGAGHMAGKLGHIKVHAGGRRCACGAHGCLEAHCSAWAFRRMDGRNPRALFRDAARGERRAQTIVEEAAEALGSALADIANVLNPDVIVIGGGMAASWPQLRRHALSRYAARALPAAAATTRVERTQLGSSAGLLGASTL